MGYTHYFYRDEVRSSDAELFEVFSVQARRILLQAEKEGYLLADAYGEKLGEWEVNEQRVVFNGYGSESHETFSWPRKCPSPIPGITTQPEGYAFDFCKTNQKPYDDVVTAVLILAKDIYGDAVRISSDGMEPDWAKGAALYGRTFGAVPRPPFEPISI